MPRQSILILAIVCAMFVVGCDSAPTHDSVAKENVTVLEDSAAVLASVTDEASANAAKPKLKELSNRLKSLKDKAEKLGSPPKEKQDELKKLYDERQAKAVEALLKESERLRKDPKLGSVLQEMQADEK